MSASAPTRTSPSTAWPRRRARAAIWEIDPATGSHRLFAIGPAQPGRPRLPARHRRALRRGQRARRARQRPRPRLSDPRPAPAPSTAGRGAITASMSTPGSSRRGPTWSRARSRPIMRSAPMSPPLGLDLRRRRAARPALRQRRLRRPARLVEPPPAQRLQGRLRAVRRRPPGGPADRRPHRLPRRARPGDGPPGRRRRSPATARCWSPTMSATPSGGSARRARLSGPGALRTPMEFQNIRLEHQPGGGRDDHAQSPGLAQRAQLRHDRRAARRARRGRRGRRALPAAHRRGPRLFERRGPGRRRRPSRRCRRRAGIASQPADRGVFALPMPVVAAVRGPCAGAGCSLALAADIVVAAARPISSRPSSISAWSPTPGRPGCCRASPAGRGRWR